MRARIYNVQPWNVVDLYRSARKGDIAVDPPGADLSTFAQVYICTYTYMYLYVPDFTPMRISRSGRRRFTRGLRVLLTLTEYFTAQGDYSYTLEYAY